MCMVMTNWLLLIGRMEFQVLLLLLLNMNTSKMVIILFITQDL